MKNLIIVLSLFYASVSGLSANSLNCNDETINEPAKSAKAANSTPTNKVRHIPVKIHILRRPDGTGVVEYSDALADIAQANALFSFGKFNFYECGPVNYIDDDYYYYNSISKDSNREFDMGNANKTADALDVFYGNTWPSGWSGIPTDLDPWENGRDWIIIDYYSTDDGSTFSHLVGRWLNLIETGARGWDWYGDYHYGENVTRDPASSCYNCETAGDKLCDTPASLGMSGDSWRFTSSCTYIGKDDNCEGLEFAPLTDNIMSLAQYDHPHCRTSFTAGQFNRMQVSYDNDRTAIHSPSCLYACATDAYEPNNKLSDANYLGTAPSYTLTDLCITYEEDEDYFKVKMDGQFFYIKVSGTNSSVGEYKLMYTAVSTPTSIVLTIQTKPNNGSSTDTYLHLYNGGGNEIATDDNGGFNSFSKITYTLPTCTKPTASQNSTSNITQTSARLNCSAVGSYRDFRYKISTSSNWTNAPHTTANYKTITSLKENTTYSWQSRVYCPGGPWSAWSPTKSFLTLGPCIPPSKAENYTSEIKQNAARLNCTTAGKYRDFRYRESATVAWAGLASTSDFYIDISGLSTNTNYLWQSRVFCPSGNWSEWSENEAFTIYNNFAPTTPMSSVLKLRNYPNPFNGQTTIEFDLENDAAVSLYVSDITGKQIQVLLNEEQRTRGINQVTFDGSDHPAGIYYYTMSAGEQLMTKKMILVK